MSSAGRSRRTPEEARREILDVAARFLRGRSFSEFTVQALMRETSVGRSTFYLYFSDVGALAVALVAERAADLFSASAPWLDEDEIGGPDGIRRAIEAVVAVWIAHGPLLRALADAARHSPDVGRAWREDFIEPFVMAIAERLARELETGRSRSFAPGETARALILMNEAYLIDRLGHEPPAVEPAVAVETLTMIWTRAIYGSPLPAA